MAEVNLYRPGDPKPTRTTINTREAKLLIGNKRLRHIGSRMAPIGRSSPLSKRDHIVLKLNGEEAIALGQSRSGFFLVEDARH